MVGLGLGAGLPGVAPAACLVFGWAFVAASSALIAWASEVVPERAAGGTALLFITLTLGQACGSTSLGLIAHRGGQAVAFMVAAGVALLAALCGLRKRQAGAAPASQAAQVVSGRSR